MLKEHEKSLVVRKAQNIRALPERQSLRIICTANICCNDLNQTLAEGVSGSGRTVAEPEDVKLSSRL